MKTFIPTKRGNECQICGDTKGKCRETATALLCMTFTEGRDRVPGFRFIGLTKNQLWGKWVTDDGRNSTEQQRAEWRQQQQALRAIRQQAEAAARSAAMPAVERNRHYRKLLGQLSLHPIDRSDLHRRGLSDEQIAVWGVKSVEQWQRLEIELPNTLPGVGIEGRSLNTQVGYLCPIPDVNGDIVGFQIRLRDGDTRYVWLTSATQKRPHGATPHLPNGELPIAVFRPIAVQRREIWTTEGTGAKPFITCDRFGVATIGAAGGLFASSPQTFKATLEKLSAELETKRVVDAVDAGAVQNSKVLRQLRAKWNLLRSWGYEVAIAWWEQFTKETLDIDELEDTSAIAFISVAEFEQIARQWNDPPLDRMLRLFGQIKKPKSKREAEPRPQLTPTVEAIEYEPGHRLDTWQQLVKQGKRYILDASGTGTGKSFDCGRVEPRDFGVRQVDYLSDQHRNPTVETLETANGWVDTEARHSGLIRESTPGGGTRLRRAKRGEQHSVAPNCNRTRTIDALRSKHIAGADTAAIICGTCPLKEACGHASGTGFGFLHDRQSSLSSPKRRSHPDSQPDPSEYDYSGTLLMWDEPGQNFTIKRDIHVSLTDLQQTIAALLGSSLFEPLQALLTALLPYFDGTAKTGRYGLNHAELTALLPDVSAIDVAAVERVLRPDLSFLNTTAAHGVDLADLPAALRKKFSERDGETAAQAESQVIKQWLPDLIRTLQGNSGNLHTSGRGLTISLPDTRHRSIAQAAKANLFLDATLSREDLALKLGCSPNEIVVIRQHVPKTDNLIITQVADLGRLGMQRGADQQRRATALVSHYQQLDPTAKAIDFKRLADEGAGIWWSTLR